MSFQNIVDFSFRALTLGGRFVLLIAIAKYLSPDDVGIYGILCSLISYVLYFLGIDFYVYSTRKIICGGVNKIWGMLYNQYVFYLFGYVLLIIVSQQVFTYSGISDYAVMGVAIALFEHMSQEMYRVLIVIKKIRAANIQLFIRSGSWCYITSLLLCIKNITDLKSVMFIWMLFSFISVCYALFVIYVEVHPKREDFILDLSWIIEGVKVSSFFFIGTICLRGIFYFDKIFLKDIVNLNIVGVYVFYFGVASAIQSFVDILVVSKYYPELIRQVNEDIDRGNVSLSKKIVRDFLNKILATAFFMCIVSIPACYFVVKFLNKSDYLAYFPVYISLLVANVVFLIAMPYHYFLYALKRDSFLVRINIFTFGLFLLLSYVLIRLFSDLTVYCIIVPIIVSYSSALFIKFYGYNSFVRGRS